jgi:hypothetical protein
MLRLRELTPIRDARGRYTGRYEYRLNHALLNRIVTNSTIAGALISGASIAIALWIGG